MEIIFPWVSQDFTDIGYVQLKLTVATSGMFNVTRECAHEQVCDNQPNMSKMKESKSPLRLAMGCQGDDGRAIRVSGSIRNLTQGKPRAQ